MPLVTDLPPKKPQYQPGGPRPSHWVDDQHSKFMNPWSSWHQYHAIRRIIPFACIDSLVTRVHPYPSPDVTSRIPVRVPTWGENEKDEMKSKIKSTWLGHACFLVELPAKRLEPRGARILFDPAFSDRCAPYQSLGPKRYTRAPCQIKDIPDVDAIVISHNHYDHTDANTLKELFARKSKPLVFAPLGNESLLRSLNAPQDNIHTMDWWQSKRVEIKIPFNESIPNELAVLSFDITCTPCQHFSGRMLWDDFRTLWSSWVIESPASSSGSTPVTVAPHPSANGQARTAIKVYFAGDTGYRSIRADGDDDSVPTCPAFKEIGDVFGGFDFAMIPIGAYEPRKVMSPIHCAPQDSVRIFKDIRARKALGMHWGTWILTTEDVDEPPQKLAEECKKMDISLDDFGVCEIGETRFW